MRWTLKILKVICMGKILDKEQFTHIKEGAIVMAYFPETTFLPEILPFMKEKYFYACLSTAYPLVKTK